MAASRRAPSAAMSVAAILWRVMVASGSVAPNTGPMAMPAETGMPGKRRSAGGSPEALGRLTNRLCWGGGGSVLFIEAGLDQVCQGVQRLLGVPAFGSEFDFRAAACAQHHQTHDRAGRNDLAFANHVNRGAEGFGHRHEARRRPSVQATFVADEN